MAQGVPGIFGRLVAGIFPPWNMAMLQIGGDILPGKIQHGAYDGQSVGPGGDGEHTVNAGGTAAEVKKGRFLLVVPVVGQSHESPRVTGGPFQKRGLPGFPGRFFNGYSAGMGHTADIDAFPDTGNTQGGGVTEHKHFLFLRFRTQLVIYMACNQIASRHAGQQGKQSHGVPPPADSGKDGAAGAEEFRGLAVKMVRCQHGAAASESGKRDQGKPANKNPVFREGNGVGKLLKAVLTC